MIGRLLAFLRNGHRLWLISASMLRLERKSEGDAALWVFDSLSAPDGYVLREHMLAVANGEDLAVHGFGPYKQPLLPGIGRFLGRLGLLFGREVERRLAELCTARIAQAKEAAGARVLLVGASKAIFPALALPLFSREAAREVQHGLLDDTYIPVRVGCFHARSAQSADIVRRLDPKANVVLLSNELGPPPVEAPAPLEATKIAGVACFSKNPGGGCTAEDLARFEQAARRLSAALGVPFTLRLHPRDKLRNLVLRHRGPGLLANVGRGPIREAAPWLVVSSFSTSLIDGSRPGDFLLNVRIGPVSPVAEMEYQWLPTVEVADLGDPSLVQVARRSSAS